MSKKLSILVLLASVSFFLSGFSFKDLAAPIYENVREQALNSFKDLFRRDVKIREAGGRLLGQIVLKGVEISPDLKAEIIKINFDPIKYAQNKGDIVPAITSLEIEKGDAKIVRDAKNNINLVELFADPKAASSGPPALPLKALIKIKDSKVNYTDRAGIYDHQKGKKFSYDFLVKSGTINLAKPPKINFSLDAAENKAKIKIKGNFDLASQQYQINLNAKDLDPKTWGPFTIPLDLQYRSGRVNLGLDLVPDKLKIEADGIINSSPIKVAGLLEKFNDLKIDFGLLISNANLREIKNSFKDLSSLDIEGTGGADISIKGPANAPAYNIKTEIKKGALYRQPFAGQITAGYKNGRLDISSSKVNIFRGVVAAQGTVDFNSHDPKINFKASSSNLNLRDISYNSPGISGLADARLNISGTLKQFAGNLAASFQNASAMGQPISTGEANFIFKEGTTTLNKLIFSSKNAYLESAGSILADLSASLSVKSKGIILSGENFTGKMRARVDNFDGLIAFKLDQQFLSSPIRNISARGTIEVSDAQVAEQLIDRGSGEISLSGGKISVPRFMIRRRDSTVYVYGQTGINVPTDLRLTSKGLNLNDAKIINLILPEQAKNPSGLCDLQFSINGKLEREEELTSLEPLLNLNYQGKISLSDGFIHNIKITSAEIDFLLKNRKIIVKNARIESGNSSVKLSLEADKDFVSLNSSGNINFNDLSPFLVQYGDFDGAGNFNLRYSGPAASPEGTLSIDFNDFSYNHVYFGRVRTQISYIGQKLSFKSPLVIESKEDKYELSGSARLDTQKLNLAFKIYQSPLEKLLPFSLRISELIEARLKTSSVEKVISKTKETILPKPFNPLYADQGKYYLKVWETVAIAFEKYKREQSSSIFREIKGNFAGQFNIEGTFLKPKVSFGARISKFFYKEYPLDLIEAEGEYSSELFNIKKLQLKKERGSLTARGTLDLKGKGNSLSFKSDNLPINMLEPFTGKKDYSGGINLNGNLTGELSDPDIRLSFNAKDISITGIKYGQISSEASMEKGEISLSHLTIQTGKDRSKLWGNFSARDNSFDLSAVLSGEGIGLINLFNEEVYFKKGETGGKIRLYQSGNKLRLEGSLVFENAFFELKKFNSLLANINIDLSAENNLVRLNRLNGYWVGKATKYKPNMLALAGTIDLNNYSADLRAHDTDLELDFKDAYSGKIKVERLAIKGPLGKPTVSAKLTFNDGVLFLPEQTAKKGSKNTPSSPLNLDLTLEFNKNMYLTAGNVDTLDLSNIFMSLEFHGRDIALKGNTNQPLLNGNLNFKRGTINVLNREFDLLSETEQERYYPYDFDQISPNLARFSSENGTMPYLNLTAAVAVEAVDDSSKNQQNSNTSPPAEKQRRTVNVVTKIKGIPGEANNINGLKTTFDAFIENKSSSPPQMSKATYSETQIKVLLLPDYVKSLVGMNENNVQSADVLADYLNSRLQVLVFRNIERKLENSLGLESLTLQYNFGKDIRRNLGQTDPYYGVQPRYGIGFVKGFFDRLYIGLKYSQFEDEQAANQWSAFNYEITYKLSPSFALAYYREPLTYTGVDTDYYKVTLKSGIQF